MKKLIAVLAVLAMVTTVAFAQASVAGTVETRFSVLRGDLSADEVDLRMGGLAGAGGAGAIGTAWLQLSGTNPDGTLGGLWRLRNNDTVREVAWFHRAFVWWRPVDMFRIWLGIDNDGMFCTSNLAGWAFHQGDNDYMFNHDWGFWRNVFPGHWDGFGMALSLMNLVEGQLNINLVLPTGGLTHPQAINERVTAHVSVQEMLAGFRFHSTFSIPGTGMIQFTYNAPGGRTDANTTWADATDFGQLGLSFVLTGLDFGNALVGGAVTIPDEGDDFNLHVGGGVTVPIPGVMELRARVGARIQTGEGRDPPRVTGNIMPVMGLGPGSLMFDLGVTMDLAEDFDPELDLGWFVGPVYRLPLAQGAFSIGLHVRSGVALTGGNQSSIVRNNDVGIHIPMLLRFSF